MKRFIASLAAAIVLLSSGFSANAYAEGSYVNFNGATSYVIGDGAQLHGGNVAQFEIGHEFPSGLGASLWWSVPASLRNIGDNSGTEIDTNVWCHLNSKTTIGASYFFMNPNKPGEAFYENDVLQVNAESKWAFPLSESVTVTPGIRGEYDFPASGRHSRLTTGLYIIPNVNVTYKADKHLTFGLMNKFNWDVTGGYGCGKALVAKVTPNVSYALSKSLSVNAGYDIYRILLKEAGDARENIGVFHFGTSCAF